MPLSQKLFLIAVVVAFSSVPLVLLYGWIVTKGWEDSAPAAAKPVSAIDPADDLSKAA
jgi:hypothetical protein